MNPFLRFVKKLSLLFGRGRFLSEQWRGNGFSSRPGGEGICSWRDHAHDARYAAVRQFGNATKLGEQSREAVAFRVETVVQDLLFALPAPSSVRWWC